MANKFDLNTIYISAGSGASATVNVASGIAPGKTRFLTYLHVERAEPISHGAITVSACSLLVGSAAESNISFAEVSAVQKFSMKLVGVEQSQLSHPWAPPKEAFMNYFPDTPNMDHPICAVTGGASSWMMIARSNAGPQIRVFAQYYDE